ncbi:MAG: 2-oxoisovalerate dehydrogenase E1 subunit beta [Planctomycetota bacterium]
MPDTAPNEVVFVVEEDAEDGGYTAACTRYGIYTQGDDLEDLRAMVRDAVACRFDDEPGGVPGPIRLHIVRDEVLA